MATLRDFPLFNQFRRRLISLLLDRKAESLLGITHSFPAFTPCSAGDYAELAKLTVSSINLPFRFWRNSRRKTAPDYHIVSR